MKYKSLYSDREVTGVQYIAEIVCKNRADNTKTELPLNFWRIQQWKPFYFLQIKIAGELSQEYNEQEIINFVRSQKIWSLASAWVKKSLDDFVNNRSKKKKVYEPIVAQNAETFSRKKETQLPDLD